MRETLIRRIQRLSYELEHIYFAGDAQRKMLLKELEKLQEQLSTLEKVIGKNGKDSTNN